MMRGPVCFGALLLAACTSPDGSPSSDVQELNLPKFASVFALDSKSQLLQTSDTAWTLTKTAAVDTSAKTVTWTITSTKGATVGGHLVVDGYLDVFNIGTGPATLGNIVVNLQTRNHDDHDCHHHGWGHDHDNEWVTIASDVADATQGDAATTANVGPIAALPGMEELNIGHFLVSRAVMVGMAEAVREMLGAMG